MRALVVSVRNLNITFLLRSGHTARASVVVISVREGNFDSSGVAGVTTVDPCAVEQDRAHS